MCFMTSFGFLENTFQFQPLWSKHLEMMPRHTYIQTYKPKYILMWVRGSNSLGPIVTQNYFFNNFFLHYTPMRSEARRDYTHVTPKVELCMHTTGQSRILAVFGLNMKTEMGGVIYMYLKHSPDYIDFKYIYIYMDTWV